MYNPATRLLTVLELLQSYPVLSGQALAQRLEVDTRTVRRYVMMLQDMGIPVEAERGRYGGYQLRPGYKIPPLMFSEDEALALIFGLLMAQQLGFEASVPAVEVALAKLERVMPLALQAQVAALKETLILQFFQPHTAVPPKGTVIIVLSLAVHQQRQVQLRYQSWQGQQTDRHVDPYGVLYRTGYWYMAGYCHLRQAIRTFRLDRIVQAKLCEETFVQPLDFDIVAHVERAIATTPGAWRVEILLQTTLAEAQAALPPALATLEPVTEGVMLRCFVQKLDWLPYVLAQLDCPLQIQQPPELKDALKALAHKLLSFTTDNVVVERPAP